MIGEIILAVVVGLVFGIINAAGATAYGMGRSNIIGEDEGDGGNFSMNDVVFHDNLF